MAARPEAGPLAKVEAPTVNRLHAVLSKVNAAMIRVREPERLCDVACRIAVEDGHFLLAWIGFLEPETQRVRIVARYGDDAGYLDSVSLSADASVPEGRGPTGMALRERRAFINNDTESNPIMRPWRDQQLMRGYRSSASLPLTTQGKGTGVITLYADAPYAFSDEEVALLTALAEDFSFAIESAETAQRETKATAELLRSYLGAISAIAKLVEGRDPYTAGHQERVAAFAVEIAEEMGLGRDAVETVRLAGLVHDIGKMQVPADILTKRTKLTESEYDVIKTHAEAGYDVLRCIEFPRPIAEVVRQHHERCDGSGYPRGLSSAYILPEARVLAVADVLEAVSADRPYRPAMGMAYALDLLREERGATLDPEVVDAALRLGLEGRGSPS
jgi:putative nucleotidyltransferase with HDIG domain